MEKNKKTSEAQKRATQVYREKNREKTRIQSARSSARSFITKYATEEDLNELQNLMNERKKDLDGIENDTEKLIDKMI